MKSFLLTFSVLIGMAAVSADDSGLLDQLVLRSEVIAGERAAKLENKNLNMIAVARAEKMRDFSENLKKQSAVELSTVAASNQRNDYMANQASSSFSAMSRTQDVSNTSRALRR